VRLLVDDSSLCFVNCHLAAHQANISARNNDAATIIKETVFPCKSYECIFVNGGDGTKILV